MKGALLRGGSPLEERVSRLDPETFHAYPVRRAFVQEAAMAEHNSGDVLAFRTMLLSVRIAARVLLLAFE